MRYSVVVHKDRESDYGVTVPDLPGCFSAGETLDEALHEVVEAIECHLEGLLLDSEPIPTPRPIEHHQNNPDYAGGVWAFITIDLAKLSGRTHRINVTLPERILTLMDRYAVEHGETRSGLIAEAALEYIASHQHPGAVRGDATT
ncbi:type II toxin-antitoxin system HicB family antitoxin [Candidatus Amarolinea aalborgensis]|jgi:predicted RNase H-like HicB family nuclease|uniref:type II toxin-antitoxin system HicB family antitoxin n=1 Tax=Candidatus Amarolinea aalborgensis TaxID=2249329 RepID=UPI003BF969F0